MVTNRLLHQLCRQYLTYPLVQAVFLIVVASSYLRQFQNRVLIFQKIVCLSYFYPPNALIIPCIKLPNNPPPVFGCSGNVSGGVVGGISGDISGVVYSIKNSFPSFLPVKEFMLASYWL